jgi:hypothetical protein
MAKRKAFLHVGATIGRWAGALRSPDRMHVIVPPSAGDAAGFTWTAFGRIVGFDAASLLLPESARPTPAPRVPPDRYEETADRAAACAKAIADGGYDVHGELADLVPARPGDEAAGTPSAEELLLASTRELGAALDGAAPRQCGCQASSSSVRVVTASGRTPSASCWIETSSNTSRSERRAAIHTCWSTWAASL